MAISTPFHYHRPQALAQAHDLLQSHPDAVLLAGGTDLVPLMKQGLKKPTQVIGLEKIPSLSRIDFRDKELFIGAMVRLGDLAQKRQVRDHCAALSEAARRVASPQIRTVGTIGGNISQDRRCIFFNQPQTWRRSLAPCFKTGGRVCHQQPKSSQCRAIYCSDLAPVLMAVEARVECYGAEGRYEQSAAEFIRRHVSVNGEMVPQRELVSRVIIPHLPPRGWVGFVKQAVRSTMDFPEVNGAVCYRPAHGPRTPASVSLVAGAVAPEPIELIETAKLILSGRIEGEVQKADWVERTLAEMHAKCALIQDTGLSPKIRKKAFSVVGRLVGQLHDYLSNSTIKFTA